VTFGGSPDQGAVWRHRSGKYLSGMRSRWGRIALLAVVAFATTAGIAPTAGAARATAGRPPWSVPSAPRLVRLTGPYAAPASATGMVDDAQAQTIDGFGASGAWWPYYAQHFSAQTKRQVGELLFSPRGLDLSQYRYNIGGGGVGVKVPYKAAPTFLVRPGVYDWSRDPGGLYFLRQAADYRVPSLIGFVNSAPAAWTTDARSCGGSLVPGTETAYAHYLADVVHHLYVADGIRLSYVSPVNEPDAAQATCTQEGMTVPVSDRAALVEAVASALSSTTPGARVIADETSLVSQLLAEAPLWLDGPARQSVAVLAHHTYDYPDTATLAQEASLPAARHWASEICCFNGKGFGWQYDPTMTSGLWLANTIWGDLAVAHDSAFDWWLALSPNLGCNPVAQRGCPGVVQARGRNDGLIYFDRRFAADGNQTLYLTKRYWVLAGFSRYVRPGDVLHEVAGLPPGLRAVAFSAGSGAAVSRWTVVVIDNAPSGSTNLHIDLPRQAVRSSSSLQTAVVTDAHADLAALTPGSAVSYRNGRLTATVPAGSVSTFVIRAR